MKKQKAISLFLVAGMLLAGLSGCGQTETSEVASTITGQVTAIEDGTITLAIGDLNEMPTDGQQAAPAGGETSGAAMQAPPDGQGGAPEQNGTPGEMPGAPGDQGQQGGTPPTPPEGTTGSAVSGDRGQGGGSRITLTGEEQQITVNDETTILINNMGESTEGSLSDISVGSVLSVTMSGDTVTEIIVISFPGKGDLPQGNTAEETDASAE